MIAPGATETSWPSSAPGATCAPAKSSPTGSLCRLSSLSRTRRRVERAQKRLEDADHAQTTRAVRPRHGTGADAVDEMLALDPQRLQIGDARGEDVARPGDVLAVASRVLVDALVVDRELAFDGHVIERGHALRPDHGEAPLLVRVKPREMEMSRQA